MGRADAKALARRDVERHGVPAGLASADGDRYRLLERRRVELTQAQAQALGKRLALGVGSNERGAGFAGVLALITGPVVGEAFERCLFAPAEMHMAARMVSGYRFARFAVPEGLRGGDLPGLKRGFIGHCLVVSHEAPAHRGWCHRGGEARGLGRLAVRVDEYVLEVGKLAADLVDLDAVGAVSREAKAGSGFDGLLLLGVAREDEFGAVCLAEAQHIVNFPAREHAGLIDDEEGLGVEGEAPFAGVCEQFCDGEGLDTAVGAERVGGNPGGGGADGGVALLTVEVDDRAKRCGLARTGRALDEGDLCLGGGVYRVYLLIA